MTLVATARPVLLCQVLACMVANLTVALVKQLAFVIHACVTPF
jgi:hypothetical protein